MISSQMLNDGNLMDKQASRELKQQISKVLWEVWDPIGVNNTPAARDEYDSYVNQVFEWLTTGDSDDVLAKKLLDIVHDRMELRRATLEHMRPTVAALRSILRSAKKSEV